MIRRPPRSTHCISSAASDVYKRQGKKPSRVLSFEDVGFDGFDEAIDVVSTLAPEQRDRACEILEGDDDETIQAFAARVRERL